MRYHLLRIALGLLFVSTAILKVADIAEFAHQLGDFGIVADDLVPAAAWLVSLSELAVGLALAVNLRGSLTVVFCLLMLFIAVLAYGIALGLDIDCGCLGPAFSVGLKTQLLIDLVLVAWCGLIWWTRKRHKASATPPHAVAHPSSTPERDSS